MLPQVNLDDFFKINSGTSVICWYRNEPKKIGPVETEYLLVHDAVSVIG
jgi:hypothetical protein